MFDFGQDIDIEKLRVKPLYWKSSHPIKPNYKEFYKLRQSLIETEYALKREGRLHESSGVRRARLRLQRLLKRLKK